MTSPSPPSTSLRERTRRAVQAEIAAHGLTLFTAHGFDATTVEQIAEAAGISSRSFFRYFATKEDVVIGDPLPKGQVLQAALAARPPAEKPWTALRRAFGSLVDLIRADPTTALSASSLMLTTPSLRARHLEKQLVWETMLVPEIARRLDPDDDADLRAHAIVAAALCCLDAAINHWVQRGGGADEMGRLLDVAMTAVKH